MCVCVCVWEGGGGGGTFQTVVSVFVVLLLLEAVGLEEGVGRVLERGDGVGSRGRGLLGARTEKCVVGCVCVEEEGMSDFDANLFVKFTCPP